MVRRHPNRRNRHLPPLRELPHNHRIHPPQPRRVKRQKMRLRRHLIDKLRAQLRNLVGQLDELPPGPGRKIDATLLKVLVQDRRNRPLLVRELCHNLWVVQRPLQGVVETRGGVEDIHVLVHDGVGFVRRHDDLAVWVRRPHKVGHVDDSAQQIAQTVEVPHDADKLVGRVGIEDLVDLPLGLLEGAVGVVFEAGGGGEVFVLEEAGVLGCGVVGFGGEVAPDGGVVAGGFMTILAGALFWFFLFKRRGKNRRKRERRIVYLNFIGYMTCGKLGKAR